ncbi:COX15/CtaA family protein [Leucobacter chromiiresistens]|uniref:Cytochrome c oxidase assembly protein subunit 15 n=1 Tax=Leucobacter chromiiresistens TaxID=1079994 RepID=A0A1H0ZTR1_9MICO|nr:COX15/CtaA family protein [Leucobacter chromiiresistens]SDQ30760.1 cytochrome c oxidase assembly protein subunit 15 [Leucobacter chromiiresistens]
MSSAPTASTTAPGPTAPAAALPSRFLRVVAWVSFVLNTLIIGTGGAVRLTGSGLGCPNWPLCAPGSLVPTEELTYHSLIEFGNRTISGPLLVSAILVLLLTWRIRAARRDLFVISAVVLGLVVLQALIGGVIVWLHLNANLVGIHYVISLALVCITAAYLTRMYEAGGPRERAVPKGFAILAHITTLAMAVTVLFGVLTTGSGPHSGDATIQRDGIDAVLMSHIHAWPGYIAFALTLSLLVWAAARRLRPLRWIAALMGALIVQIAIGIYQARSGLPPLAVGVHMVLAALTAAAMTVVVLRLKRPATVSAVAAS